MGIFKKGKNWFIDYYVQGCRKKESIGPSKELAQMVLKKRKVQIAENKFLDVRKQKRIHFRDMARLYLESYSKLNKKSWDRDAERRDPQSQMGRRQPANKGYFNS